VIRSLTLELALLLNPVRGLPPAERHTALDDGNRHCVSVALTGAEQAASLASLTVRTRCVTALDGGSRAGLRVAGLTSLGRGRRSQALAGPRSRSALVALVCFLPLLRSRLARSCGDRPRIVRMLFPVPLFPQTPSQTPSNTVTPTNSASNSESGSIVRTGSVAA